MILSFIRRKICTVRKLLNEVKLVDLSLNIFFFRCIYVVNTYSWRLLNCFLYFFIRKWRYFITLILRYLITYELWQYLVPRYCFLIPQYTIHMYNEVRLQICEYNFYHTLQYQTSWQSLLGDSVIYSVMYSFNISLNFTYEIFIYMKFKVWLKVFNVTFRCIESTGPFRYKLVL